jgi:hypothetical protein
MVLQSVADRSGGEEAAGPGGGGGTGSALLAGRPPKRPVGEWRRVLLPTEHGSWAFLAEPVVLGWLVAVGTALER